ncbi:MAG: hypothetical protein HY727_19970 [Candidatus Rokubacteria bacterium]|nr:hypothetical protein [Candidatus Rokubacteria bacterium]
MRERRAETDYRFFLGPRAENLPAVVAATTRVLDGIARLRAGEAVNPEELPASCGDPALDALVDDLLRRLARSTPFTSPGYLAHMNTGVLVASVLGTIAGLFPNPNVIVRESAPGLLEMEAEVVRDLMTMLGLDPAAGWGYLTGGGTLANQDALWRARKLKEAILEMGPPDGPLSSRDVEEALFRWTPTEVLEAYETWRARRPARAPGPVLWRGHLDDAPPKLGEIPGVVLAPSTTHYSVEKALDIVGLGRRRLIWVPVDAAFRLDTSALRATLRALWRARVPVLAVIANVGTTEEGAVDPLDDVLAVCRETRAAGGPACWVHADAALGGYLATLRRDGSSRDRLPRPDRSDDAGAPLNAPVVRALDALGEADSVTVDPHKWGLVPYGAGAILYRDRRMAGLTAFDASYLWRGGVPEYASPFTVEGSRPGTRVLSVWAAQRVLPLDRDGHGRLVATALANAQRLAALLDAAPAVEAHGHGVRLRVLTEPDSCIVTWLCVPTDAPSLGVANALNRMVALRYRYDGQVPPDAQDYIVSSTDLEAARYGDALRPILARVGLDLAEFPEEAPSVRVLRCTLMHPWPLERSLEGFVESVRTTVANLLGLVPILRSVRVGGPTSLPARQ